MKHRVSGLDHAIRQLEPMVVWINKRNGVPVAEKPVAAVHSNPPAKITRRGIPKLWFGAAGLFVAAVALGIAHKPRLTTLLRRAD